ncbi:D-ribitol-5-phosphate cytidylyltransferase-like isoform X2 [Ptychodera flava]
MKEIIDKYQYTKVQLVEGAASRHRTIKKCLESIPATALPDVVILHDAVRPFANENVLSKVSQAAYEHGACGAIQPLVSTVISPTQDGFLSHCLVRSNYTASHTPQAFRLTVMTTAYSKATEQDLDHGTECLELALKYTGTRAKLIQDDGDIWKVTYKRDLYAADGLAKEIHTRVAIFQTNSSDINQALEEKLCKKGLQVVAVCSKVCDIPESANSVVLCTNAFTEEVVSTVENIASILQARCQYGGSLVMVVSNGNSSAEREVSEKSREFCQSLSQRVRSSGLCINVVIATEENSNPDSLRNDVAAMVTDLIFNQNAIFSGQVFQLPS